MRNFDVSTLRSFVTVAQTGGVTRASGFLNLTQSAVSMQLKRLEDLVGQALFERSGRGIVLTPSGEQFLGYARRMVALNDEAFERLTTPAFVGEIAFGVPHDIVYPVIPQVLQRFHTEFPRVKVQLLSSYTRGLKEKFSKGALDVILTTEVDRPVGGETLTQVPLRWVGAPGGQAFRQRPLRVAFSRHCGFRKSASDALEASNIPWEIAVDSESDRTVEATVSADLAVTAMLEGHAPPHMTHVDGGCDLPELQMHNINMYGNSARPEIVDPLMDMTRQGFATL